MSSIDLAWETTAKRPIHPLRRANVDMTTWLFWCLAFALLAFALGQCGCAAAPPLAQPTVAGNAARALADSAGLVAGMVCTKPLVALERRPASPEVLVELRRLTLRCLPLRAALAAFETASAELEAAVLAAKAGRPDGALLVARRLAAVRALQPALALALAPDEAP